MALNWQLSKGNWQQTCKITIKSIDLIDNSTMFVPYL